MTLLHMDSFQLGDASLRYPSPPGSFQASGGRFGGGYHRWTSNGVLTHTFTASSTIVVGFAMRTSSSSTLSFYGDTNATQHVTITFNSTGLIDVRRGNTSGTVLQQYTSTSPRNLTGWEYYEIKVTISDTVGVVKIRMNGVATDIVDFSGDTKNAGTNVSVDAFRFTSNSTTNTDIQDLYVLNSSGSVNNDFLGDIRVYPLMPNANGTSSGLTGTDLNSTDNYLQVDEKPYNTSDYNYSGTATTTDLYNVENLPANVTSVFAIQEVAIAAKSDAGAISGKRIIRPTTTNYASASLSLSTTFSGFYSIRETNPDTSTAWTASEVNSTQIGWEVA